MEIKIRSQSLPQRCEICHQSDCFDAASNHCSRCHQLQQSETVKKVVVHPLEPLDNWATLKEIAITFLSVLRIVVGSISVFVCFGLVCAASSPYTLFEPGLCLCITGFGMLALIMLVRPDRRTLWIVIKDIIITASISAILWPICAYLLTYHFQYMGKLLALTIGGFNAGLAVGVIWHFLKFVGRGDMAGKFEI